MPLKTNLEPEPVNTNWGPGLVNANQGPGPVNTIWEPGPWVGTGGQGLGPSKEPGAGEYKYSFLSSLLENIDHIFEITFFRSHFFLIEVFH